MTERWFTERWYREKAREHIARMEEIHLARGTFAHARFMFHFQAAMFHLRRERMAIIERFRASPCPECKP